MPSRRSILKSSGILTSMLSASWPFASEAAPAGPKSAGMRGVFFLDEDFAFDNWPSSLHRLVLPEIRKVSDDMTNAWLDCNRLNGSLAGLTRPSTLFLLAQMSPVHLQNIRVHHEVDCEEAHFLRSPPMGQRRERDINLASLCSAILKEQSAMPAPNHGRWSSTSFRTQGSAGLLAWSAHTRATHQVR